VIVAQMVGQRAQNLLQVLHHLRPDRRLEQLDVIAQILGTLAPLVKCLVGPRRVRLCGALPFLPVAPPKTGLKTGEALLMERPNPDSPAESLKFAADRGEDRSTPEAPEGGAMAGGKPLLDGIGPFRREFLFVGRPKTLEGGHTGARRCPSSRTDALSRS